MSRLKIALLTSLSFMGCPSTNDTAGPPLNQFYFPAGIAHVDVPGKQEGVLFVANANLDKRYGTGSIVAVQLDALGLPALGAAGPTVHVVEDLLLKESQSVQISSFAGQMAVQTLGPNRYRLYVPTRSENATLYQTLATLDADGVPSLSCINATSQNCVGTGPNLTPHTFEQLDAGVRWPLSPYGVAVAPRGCSQALECCTGGATDCGRTCTAGQCMGTDGEPFADVWVSNIPRGDTSVLLNGQTLMGSVVRVDSDNFSVTDASFIPLGPGPSNSVAVVGSWVYLSGRIFSPAPSLLRLVNREREVISTGLESTYRVSDARGIAASSDGRRLYVVGRSPDTLLIHSLNDTGGVPGVNLMRAIPLPDAPNELRVIARAGRGDLVAVTCSSSGAVAVYDDDLGDLVAVVPGVGSQPFAIAVDNRGSAARLYVSNFGDGRIAVIDIADLNRPQGARLVARLGAPQLCLTKGKSSSECVGSKGATP